MNTQTSNIEIKNGSWSIDRWGFDTSNVALLTEEEESLILSNCPYQNDGQVTAYTKENNYEWTKDNRQVVLVFCPPVATCFLLCDCVPYKVAIERERSLKQLGFEFITGSYVFIARGNMKYNVSIEQEELHTLDYEEKYYTNMCDFNYHEQTAYFQLGAGACEPIKLTSDKEPAVPQHTPGPWMMDSDFEDNAGICWKYPDGWVMNAGGKYIIEYQGPGSHQAHWNNPADKALVLAAPDLLEALQAILNIVDGDGTAFDKARAAIAKATQST